MMWIHILKNNTSLGMIVFKGVYACIFCFSIVVCGAFWIFSKLILDVDFVFLNTQIIKSFDQSCTSLFCWVFFVICTQKFMNVDLNCVLYIEICECYKTYTFSSSSSSSSSMLYGYITLKIQHESIFFWRQILCILGINLKNSNEYFICQNIAFCKPYWMCIKRP